MSAYSLIRRYEPEDVFAWRAGEAVSASRFLAEVAALAAALPARKYVVNLCSSRYNFTLGLAAAMVCNQVSLLPPNDAPGTLKQLGEDYPDLYCLTDRDVAPGDLPVLRFPDVVPIGGLEIENPVFPAGQIAALLFTSGSTGRPRAQAKTWGGFVRSTLSAGERLDIASLPGATVIGTVPHQHSYGIESTVLLALQHGLTISDTRPLLPADICAAIEDAPRPRILVSAPIHLKALLADGEDMPAADLVLSATAPLSQELAAKAEAAFDAPLFEIYGCSEAGQIATRRTAREDRWECFDGITLRQDESGSWAQGDAVGDEVLLNDTLNLFDKTHFILQGRTADLINIAGKRNSLSHLTHHLNSIPGVIDGAFVLPEGDATRLMAFVVAPGIGADTIMAALRQHVDPAFLPRPLHIVDALPRNELGKLPRDASLRLADMTVKAKVRKPRSTKPRTPSKRAAKN